MNDQTQPQVYGLESDPMPDNWTPIECFTILKCLDENGEVALLTRATEGISTWETVGMLTAALDTQRDDLRAWFLKEDEEE
jgi:hypothetical protein